MKAHAAEEVWFSDGLRFECTRCGNCCTGEPGYVWLNEAETAALAAACGETLERFIDIYCRPVGTRRSLRELDDGSCVFYRPGVGCTVYEHRPRQCRTWPFWDSNLDTPTDWAETSRGCPGIGQGRIFTVEEILAQSRVISI